MWEPPMVALSDSVHRSIASWASAPTAGHVLSESALYVLLSDGRIAGGHPLQPCRWQGGVVSAGAAGLTPEYGMGRY
jgi:hypothetical protein